MLKLYRCMLWRKVEGDSIVHEVWLINITDDRMVRLFSGSEVYAADYARNVSWGFNCGPIRYRDSVRRRKVGRGRRDITERQRLPRPSRKK